MRGSAAKLMRRKAKGQKAAFKKLQIRKCRKGGWGSIPDPSSKEKETHLIREAFNLTFECERLHCRLLPESCIQRQKSWYPEIYEGCIGCKQGLEIARKMRHKNKGKKAA